VFKFLPDPSNSTIQILAKNHIKLLSGTPRTFKAYFFYYFSWIKIQTKNEDVDVTKLVYFVVRIPKHFILHFSDFSTIF
jgi:hypothetical protein